MRVRFLSLTAAAGVVLFLSGPASAQYRGYYTPSNYGMSNHFYQPSNYGMSNHFYHPSNYGNPGASPIAGSYAGSLTAGSAVPLGSVGNLGTLAGAAPLGGGFGTFSVAPSPSGVPAPTNTPMTASNVSPLNPAAVLTPNNIAETGTTNPATPEGAATAPLAPPPAMNPLAFGSTGAPAAGPAPNIANTALPPTQYFAPYTAPQYQSSFYEPLRRVYGYSGY